MAHKLSATEHANIVSMIEAGMSTKKISKITARSTVTIQRVNKWRHYPDYEKNSHQAANKRGSSVNEDTQIVNESAEESYEALLLRVSFELGETARKAIDGLLALVGVKE